MTIDKPMSLEAAQAIVATKTAPKVTKESIEAKIVSVDYIKLKTSDGLRRRDGEWLRCPRP